MLLDDEQSCHRFERNCLCTRVLLESQALVLKFCYPKLVHRKRNLLK